MRDLKILISEKNNSIKKLSSEINWKVKEIIPLIPRISAGPDNKEFSLSEKEVQGISSVLKKLNRWFERGEDALNEDLKDLNIFSQYIYHLREKVRSIHFDGGADDEDQVVTELVLELLTDIEVYLLRKDVAMRDLVEYIASNSIRGAA